MTAANNPKTPARPRAAKPAAARPGVRALPPRPGMTEPDEPYRAPETPDGIIRFTQTQAREEKRSVLFTIDDAEYTVLDNPGAELGLQYLDKVSDVGDAAIPWAMETMLGAEGWNALKTCKDLPLDGLTRVIAVVTGKITGSLQDPKGRSGSV